MIGGISPQTFCSASAQQGLQAGMCESGLLALISHSSFTSFVTLCLSSVVCKMGIMTVLNSQSSCEV